LDQPDHTKVPVGKDPFIMVLADFINAIYQKIAQSLWYENIVQKKYVRN